MFRLLSTTTISGSFRRLQPVQAVGHGKIDIADSAKIGVRNSPIFLSTYAYLEARKPSGSIRIGACTWISNNFCAMADSSTIEIGSDCVIGYNVELLGSDFHGLDASARHIFSSAPITIGNRVFIGSNVKILKGVSIGDGSTIANGSVVTKSIGAGMLAGGNPARVIRNLAEHAPTHVRIAAGRS